MSESEHDAQSSEPFLHEVHQVAMAETDAARKMKEASDEAARIRAQAQEKAVETAAQATQAAVGEKNRIIAAGRKKTDEKARKLLEEAAIKSAQLSSRRLSESAAQEICDLI
ncbi:MAG: hypothetical protein V1728_06335 [Candidatus Micrarchaeota archaeon]